MSAEPMTCEEWVEAALAARVEQGLPEHIEDPAVLDFLAGVLAHPGTGEHTTVK